MEKTEFIWINGKFENWEESKTHTLTHALHYGTGVFEGIRVYETKKGPAIFRLNEHIKRLFESAKALNIKISFTEEEIIQGVKETVKKNNLKSGYIRPIAYYGYGKMGLDTIGAIVDVVIAVWPWGAYLGEEGKKNGIRAKISEFSRHNLKEGLNLVKATGFYTNSMLAKMDALNTGFNEAILLDDKKNVCECSGENIFIIKNNILYTPTIKNCLNGITRNSIIKIANDKGYEVIEKDITIKELLNSDGCFVTGTAAEITSIVNVGEKNIGDGKVNSIAKELQEEYEKIITGQIKDYFDWLCFLED
jgi:branched-chain amino acid aminotransferase